jgi:septal ring factor EnvC (AmiA/AmiB activator)
MEKDLISALATGSCGAALTAFIAGLFQRSFKNVDKSIAGREYFLKENDQSFKQLQTILDETKEVRDSYKTRIEQLESDASNLATKVKVEIQGLQEQLAQMQEAHVFLLVAALRNNKIEDLQDLPMTEDMRRLYDLAVKNEKPANQILDRGLLKSSSQSSKEKIPESP